jgi:cysteine desulfurase family protein (TIGR01976 family)
MPFTEDDSHRCRRDFPSLNRGTGGLPLAYLDGPAGTQVPRAVIDAVTRYYETCNANAHGRFVTSAETDRVLLEAREAAADLLGAPSAREISLGANMTTLAFSLAHALGRGMQPGDEVVITELDHEANRGPWLMLRERGIVVREVAVRRDGRLDPEDARRKITDRARVVAVGAASNALGTVNDLALFRDLSRSAGAYLVVDAVHFAPHFPTDVGAIDCDFLLCSAYKFYGPHVGILYARSGLLDRLEVDRLRTASDDSPERIETGTLNHAAIAGVAAAIEYLASWGSGADRRARLVSAMEGIAAHEHALARRYFEGLREIPGVTAWGPDVSGRDRAPTVSITIDGVPAAEAAQRLGEKGILVWDGHFYAIRPVEVLGLAERGGLLRTGMSMYNTAGEIDRLLEEIRRLAAGR